MGFLLVDGKYRTDNPANRRRLELCAPLPAPEYINPILDRSAPFVNPADERVQVYADQVAVDDQIEWAGRRVTVTAISPDASRSGRPGFRFEFSEYPGRRMHWFTSELVTLLR